MRLPHDNSDFYGIYLAWLGIFIYGLGRFMLQALNVFLVGRTGVMRTQGSFTWVYAKSQYEAGFGNQAFAQLSRVAL